MENPRLFHSTFEHSNTSTYHSHFHWLFRFVLNLTMFCECDQIWDKGETFYWQIRNSCSLTKQERYRQLFSVLLRTGNFTVFEHKFSCSRDYFCLVSRCLCLTREIVLFPEYRTNSERNCSTNTCCC
jgi:hypothetical protein